MPLLQDDGTLQHNKADVNDRRKQLMTGYFRSRGATSQVKQQTRTMLFSKEYPCPKYLGKKGAAIWDMTINSYKEELFKEAFIPILESYVLLGLEVQRLRLDVARNGFFEYVEDRRGEEIMRMRHEATHFLNLCVKMQLMLTKMGIIGKFDTTGGTVGDPAEKMAEKEGLLIGSTSNRSHLLGKEDDDGYQIAA